MVDRFQGLKLVLAHGGGPVPFLADRLDSCVAHDESIKQPQSKPSDALSRTIFDAVVYSDKALRLVVDFAGADSVVFGTDHPFSISEADTVLGTIESLARNDDKLRSALRGANAARLMRLQ